MPGNVIWKIERVGTTLPRDGSKKRNRFHHGFIAQEVKASMDYLGVDFGGFQDHAIAGGKDVLSIGYDEFIAPIIKAIQELSKKNDDLTAERSEMKTRLAELTS